MNQLPETLSELEMSGREGGSLQEATASSLYAPQRRKVPGSSSLGRRQLLPTRSRPAPSRHPSAGGAAPPQPDQRARKQRHSHHQLQLAKRRKCLHASCCQQKLPDCSETLEATDISQRAKAVTHPPSKVQSTTGRGL